MVWSFGCSKCNRVNNCSNSSYNIKLYRKLHLTLIIILRVKLCFPFSPHQGISIGESFFFLKQKNLENVFMKHYAPNHMLAPKKGSSQKGMQLKP